VLNALGRIFVLAVAVYCLVWSVVGGETVWTVLLAVLLAVFLPFYVVRIARDIRRARPPRGD
jgi:Flp pilus assembly protein TadB